MTTLANIRRAIYYLNKRIDLLRKNINLSESFIYNLIISRIETLELLMSDEENPTLVIDKFNEIVDFLSSIDNTLDLVSILNSYALKEEIPTKTSDLINDRGFLTEHQDISGKANSSDLAAVATSGSYNDLSNKPTIPTIPINVSAFNNDTGYLTEHQSLDDYYTKTETNNKINKYVEENLYTAQQAEATFQQKITSQNKLNSDLVDDTNNTNKFVTAEEKVAWNAKSDFSGSYNDLTDKPHIPNDQVQANWGQTNSSKIDYIKNKPTNVSEFTNDAGYLTEHQSLDNYYTKSEIDTQQTEQNTAIATKAPQSTTYTKTEVNNLVSPKANSADLATVATSGNYNDLSNRPTIPVVPTNVSAFTNDAGYLTSHQDISGKVDKTILPTLATKEEAGVEIDNTHEYVDLGLPSGTKWATMNVGASSETDYGNYYQYGKGAAQYAATSGDSDYGGTEDPLDSSVDTASQVWGGSWHMPTRAQMQELTANTTYQWVTNYKGSGINGGTFTATNGAVLFIPAAGYWFNGSQYDVGDHGGYWGSSPNGSSNAYSLYFYDGDKDVGSNYRKGGYSVRPVCDTIPIKSNKADKVINATSGNLAGLNSEGNITDSGKKPTDFADVSHTHIKSDITDLPDYATDSDINNIIDPTNGHEYVEIGGLKWATMNIGAESITDYGLYFQWGDIQGYTATLIGNGEGLKYFYWTDYKYGDGTNITKYNPNDKLTTLSADDDAAQAIWGGCWRTPTTEEFQALSNAVNTEWTANYKSTGIAGIICTAKDNSEIELFFPAAGDCYNGNLDNVGSYGIYWNSSLLTFNILSAYSLLLNNDSVTWLGSNVRYKGGLIRGILDISSIDKNKLVKLSLVDTFKNKLSNVTLSGSYSDLINKPILGTASTKDVASSGNASTSQVVMGNDTRLSDSRNAADVSAWAKAANKPSYNLDEVADGTNRKIPTKISELSNDSGFTGNTGTVTSVKIGTDSYSPTSGIVELPAYPTSLPADGGNAATVNNHSVNKDVPADADFTNTWRPLGTGATDACAGNDSRLSDARTPTSHTHGNIKNTGALLDNDVSIANGDKLVITDNSDSGKVARSSVSFDGSTTNKALTPKGTFEAFLQNHLTKTDLGLNNVTNDAQVKRSEMGVADGVATLGSDGKVPSSQLPAFVDDVIEGYLNGTHFYKEVAHTNIVTDATGVSADLLSNKVYIDLATSKSYRWAGSTYGVIGSDLALGETSSTAYYGDKGKIAYDHSQSTHARTDATKVEGSSTNGNIKINGTETTVYTHPSGTNPHGTTKSDVGLGNVGNFKAVSTEANQGLSSTEKSNARANIGAGTSSIVIGTNSGNAADGAIANSHYSNTSNPHSVTKSQVGLGNVVNTGDSATPVENGTTKFTTGGAYTELNKKVDKVTGKGLSTNDYTTDEKNKLSGIQSNATKVESSSNGKIKINGTDTTVYTHPTTAGNKHIPSGGSSGQFLGYSASGTAQWVNNPNTDTSVTSAENHYTPERDTNADKTATATGATAAWSIDVVKGVTVQTDSKGHVTGVTVDSGKIPANPNTNTIPSAYCDTAAATAAKVASCTGYTLTANTYIHLIVVNANSYNGAITLNINGKGAKDVYINGAASSSSNKTLPAGSYIAFYDGTRYQIRTDGKIPANISGDAATVNGKTVAVSVPSGAVFTDTSVTAVGNHYAPSADANSEITASLDGTAGAYAKDTEYTVLTGVKAQRDAKGHVTGLTYTAQKVKDTNTTYSSKTAASGGTDTSLVTTGEKYTWNAKQGAVAKLGSTTKPVYTSAAGTFAECSTYAGGTAVTLNGTSKAASTATMFAPTSVGTAGQVLTSSGSGAPIWKTGELIYTLTNVSGTAAVTTSPYYSSIWTGTASGITSLYTGLMVNIKVPVAGNSTYGVVLDVNNLGEKPVISNVNTNISTRYAVGCIITLIYDADLSTTVVYLNSTEKKTITGCWKISDYDYNSDAKTSSSNKASTKLYLVGATSQSTSGQTTYSNSNVYVGTDNCLYSNGKVVPFNKELDNEDLNSITIPGFYNAGGGNTCTNKPSGVASFGLEVIHTASGSYYTQIVYKAGTNTSYRRNCNNGTWSDWVEEKLTDTTYTSKAAASGGTDISLVTTGEKAVWNAKQNALTNPVTGTGLTTDKIVLGNGTTTVKTSSKEITTTAPTSTSDDTTIPTSKAVYSAVKVVDDKVNLLEKPVENALISRYTLEQSSNPQFDVINRGAAERYIAEMGGYAFLIKDNKVYAAKLNCYNWTKFADGTEFTSALEAATETMIHVPDCHFKASGKTMNFGGLTHIDGGKVFGSPHWVGAYKMYIDNNQKGHSRPGVSPSYSKGIYEFWLKAQNLGSNFGLANYQFHCLINALYQTRYGNLNSQSVIGSGFTAYSNGLTWQQIRDIPMGLTKSLGDGSGNVLYVDTHGDNQYPVKLFGFEDLWNKHQEFRSGICFYDDNGTFKALVYDGNITLEENDTTRVSGREIIIDVEEGLFTQGTFCSKMTLGEWWDMIGISIENSGDNLYYCDSCGKHEINPDGNSNFVVSGRAGHGKSCGISTNRSFYGTMSSLGSRLAFYGEPEIISGAELAALAAS